MMPHARDRSSIPTLAAESSQNLRAIRRRLRKAFPQISELFPVLSDAMLNGSPWREVLDDYADRLGDTRLSNLCDEANDLFRMGWNEAQFDLVTSDIFGLDKGRSGRESFSAYEFVMALTEHLSNDRLARGSKRR